MDFSTNILGNMLRPCYNFLPFTMDIYAFLKALTALVNLLAVVALFYGAYRLVVHRRKHRRACVLRASYVKGVKILESKRHQLGHAGL